MSWRGTLSGFGGSCVCAVVAVGATLLTLGTTLVLGNILREIAVETFDALRGWWAG